MNECESQSLLFLFKIVSKKINTTFKYDNTIPRLCHTRFLQLFLLVVFVFSILFTLIFCNSKKSHRTIIICPNSLTF